MSSFRGIFVALVLAACTATSARLDPMEPVHGVSVTQVQAQSRSQESAALLDAVQAYIATGTIAATEEGGDATVPAEKKADSAAPPGKGETASLAEKSQNPVSDLISLPFQNNTGFNYGVDNDVQNVLNIQPVYPFSLNEDWNVITRTVIPVIYQPSPAPGVSDEFGLGDSFFTAFFSPRESGKWTWGVGPQVLIPTKTNDTLGVGQWGLGVQAVALTIKRPWVAGALIGNTWSFEGDFNQFLVQPFVNYNMKGGWFLGSSPIITANWEAGSGNTWTVPIGGGIGKVTRIGKQPINVQVQFFYNIEHPDVGPDWTVRFQLQFLFPK